MPTRAVHHVRRVGMGDATSWHDGKLTVSTDEARAILAAPCLADVRITWTSPGDSVRIVKVLDVVEPRAKGPGCGPIFPGWLGSSADHDVSDPGITLVMRGAAVVVAGYLPRAQEAVIDMSGPAAELSPFGSTHNLVIEFTPVDGADWADVDDALRRGSLALAAHLAEAAYGSPPDEEETLPDPGAPGSPAMSGLPKVATITNLQTQGVFKDVFVRGKSFNGQPPTLIDPAEIDDGAVVSGQFGHPSLRNPTWVHQNHPVVNALRARHGRDLAFAGVVLSPEPVSAADKAAVSAAAAQLCADAGFDAVILTKEGGGNADADMSLKMDALEDLGMAAVGLFAEMAGPDGTGPPVVVPPERATAMISTGNYDTRLSLPEMERALGGDELALLSVPATSAMELPTAVILAALGCLGGGRLTCAQPGTTEGTA